MKGQTSSHTHTVSRGASPYQLSDGGNVTAGQPQTIRLLITGKTKKHKDKKYMIICSRVWWASGVRGGDPSPTESVCVYVCVD